MREGWVGWLVGEVVFKERRESGQFEGMSELCCCWFLVLEWLCLVRINAHGSNRIELMDRNTCAVARVQCREEK